MKIAQAILIAGIALVGNPVNAQSQAKETRRLDHPNPRKGRQMIESVGETSSVTVTNSPAGGNALPSFEETVHWIDKNKEYFSSTFVDDPIQSMVSMIDEVRSSGSKLIVTRSTRLRIKRTGGEVFSLSEFTIDFSRLYGELKEGNSEKELTLEAKDKSIQVRTWSMARSADGEIFFNGSSEPTQNPPVSWEDLNYTQSRITLKASPPTRTRQSDSFSIELGRPDYLPRLKKAFENMIKVAGGGGTEPF